MMKQMESYLDGEIGENIFPIRLEEEPLDASLAQEGWNELMYAAPLPVPPIMGDYVDIPLVSGSGMEERGGTNGSCPSRSGRFNG